MMNQNLPTPQTGLHVVVTKGKEQSVEIPVEVLTMPAGVVMALTEAKAWWGGVQGSLEQLANDCQRHQRDSGMLAVQRALEGFNKACAVLVEQVFELEVLE